MTWFRKQIAKDDLHSVSEEHWDDDPKGLAGFLNSQGSFEEQLQTMADSLDDELERRGLPRWSCKVIIENDRERWHVAETGARPKNDQSLASASVLIWERAEPLSDDWFIAKMRKSIQMFFAFDAAGSKSQALTEVFNLGTLFHAAKARSILPDVSRGKGTIRSARKGGEMRSRHLSKETTSRLSEMQRLIDAGHNLSNAARLAAQNGYGSSMEANRSLWKRHRK